MKPNLPYWVSPIREGANKHGPYLACDVAKSRSDRRAPKTVQVPLSELQDMTAQERSKYVALMIHEAARSLGLIPEDWKLL